MWTLKDLKNAKCPYCGRRARYSAVFSHKKKGVYTCSRCKKESKVKVDKKVLVLFAALCLLIVVFMIIWCGVGLANNIFGTIIVALLLFGFYLCTPYFVSFVPIKKHTNDTITQKYYDEDLPKQNIDNTFVFNKEAFDRIKKQKLAGALDTPEEEVSSHTKVSERMVPIIEDVKESHSSSDEPLHKIEKPQTPHVSPYESYRDEPVREYTPRKKKKPNGTRYTANRKF